MDGALIAIFGPNWLLAPQGELDLDLDALDSHSREQARTLDRQTRMRSQARRMARRLVGGDAVEPECDDETIKELSSRSVDELPEATTILRCAPDLEKLEADEEDDRIEALLAQVRAFAAAEPAAEGGARAAGSGRIDVGRGGGRGWHRRTGHRGRGRHRGLERIGSRQGTLASGDDADDDDDGTTREDPELTDPSSSTGSARRCSRRWSRASSARRTGPTPRTSRRA